MSTRRKSPLPKKTPRPDTAGTRRSRESAEGGPASIRGPGAKPARTPPTTTAPAVFVSNPTPWDLLLPYQRRWADDEARWKIGLMSRQVGKDFSSGGEGVRDILRSEQRGEKTTWLIAAPSERQALESFEKWKEWAEAFAVALDGVVEDRESPEAVLKSATMVFPKGSRVIAVPGKPDTVRGFSANILLTEFAFFEDPDRTWRAILPSITNPLRGGLKKVRLISTPNGQGNKFHDLWVKNHGVDGGKWSTHKVTIHDAIAQGLPVDAEELRAALDDPDGWAQEYLCEFMDVAAVLLPYEILAPCENPMATEAAPAGFWERNPNAEGSEDLYCGIDFGRKRDLTVCWTLAKVAGTYHLTREVLTLEKTSTPKQLEILRPRISHARRVCFDYTGPGVGLGDLMVKEFGEWNPTSDEFGKVELCTFTNEVKQEIFPKLRMACENRVVGLPSSRVIREDLHSVHRVSTPGGNITYKAPHTPDGHADRATALALALRAARSGGGPFRWERASRRSGGTGPRSRQGRSW